MITGKRLPIFTFYRWPIWLPWAVLTHFDAFIARFTAGISGKLTSTWMISWRLGSSCTDSKIYKSKVKENNDWTSSSCSYLWKNGRFVRRMFRGWWIRLQNARVQSWRNPQWTATWTNSTGEYFRLHGRERMCFWYGLGFEEKVQFVFAPLFTISDAVGGQNEDVLGMSLARWWLGHFVIWSAQFQIIPWQIFRQHEGYIICTNKVRKNNIFRTFDTHQIHLGNKNCLDYI